MKNKEVGLLYGWKNDPLGFTVFTDEKTATAHSLFIVDVEDPVLKSIAEVLDVEPAAIVSSMKANPELPTYLELRREALWKAKLKNI